MGIQLSLLTAPTPRPDAYGPIQTWKEMDTAYIQYVDLTSGGGNTKSCSGPQSYIVRRCMLRYLKEHASSRRQKVRKGPNLQSHEKLGSELDLRSTLVQLNFDFYRAESACTCFAWCC